MKKYKREKLIVSIFAVIFVVIVVILGNFLVTYISSDLSFGQNCLLRIPFYGTVVLCGIEIKDDELKSLQEYAIQNIDEDTEGIYLGTFPETIDYYRKNPTPFAGGKKAAPYNFPNRKELMERAIKYSQLNENIYR